MTDDPAALNRHIKWLSQELTRMEQKYKHLMNTAGIASVVMQNPATGLDVDLVILEIEEGEDGLVVRVEVKP